MPVTIDVVDGAVHGAAEIACEKRTATRCELVDRLRIDVPSAVAAEVVRAQRIGDVDDDVHERGGL